MGQDLNCRSQQRL